LGNDKYETVTNSTDNARNGKSRKTLKSEFGKLPIEIPRDRAGNLEPQIIPKHQTPLDGLWLLPTLISTVTDGVIGK